MNGYEIERLVEAQRRFFASGATLPVRTRIRFLKLLYRAITQNLSLIHRGLRADLGKCESESYMCETGLVLDELSFQIKHLKKFAKPRRVKTPLSQFRAKSYTLPSPYGCTLIMSPWNYPFLLALSPMIDAVAAGNTAMLKLSSYAPNTNDAIKTVIEQAFPPQYVTVLFGGREVNEAVLNIRFDYIFFTGSKHVGKLVYAHAAKHLAPVTLELGGKSPCIVDETANIPLAAKRIVWGKFLNLGQTCVAPDYILCAESIHERLVSELKKQIVKQFGTDPLSLPDYGKIVNQKHFERLLRLLDENKTVHGGRADFEKCSIEPTVLDNVCFNDPVMQEEIFGPILPVTPYHVLDEALGYVNSHERPLALYLFTKDKKRAKRILRETGFGGGCVNDTVVHLATPYLPFGGFGESGLGAYHGKAGFDTFSHFKGIVDKKSVPDLALRYRPYTKKKQKLIRKFLK